MDTHSYWVIQSWKVEDTMAKKKHLEGPPPFNLWLWLLPWFMVYQIRKDDTPISQKKVLTYRLRGCRASRGERRRSANLRHIMVSIQIFANLHYIEVSIRFNITIIGILVLVVISVLKILLFTVNTSLITNLSKWCIIHCFNSDFVFL